MPPIKSIDKDDDRGQDEVLVKCIKFSPIAYGFKVLVRLGLQRVIVPNQSSSRDTGANLLFSGRFHRLVCQQQHLLIEEDPESTSYVLF